MPSNPERLGKSHEKLTRDLLNGTDAQPDTRDQLEYLDADDRERVRIGSEKAASFIRKHTPFEIVAAFEEGDAKKPDPDDDVDVVVEGAHGESKGYSLKLTSDTAINVRNTLASKMAEDIFERPLDELFDEGEYATYQSATAQFVDEAISSSEMAGQIIPIFARKFAEFRDRDEATLRANLLRDVRLESNTVACKVTAAGNFYGFASMDRAPLRKFKDGEGTLEIYTKDSNNTSIFFDVDGESAFRIDMYGQYAGSTRKARIKTVYRVTFG